MPVMAMYLWYMRVYNRNDRKIHKTLDNSEMFDQSVTSSSMYFGWLVGLMDGCLVNHQDICFNNCLMN